METGLSTENQSLEIPEKALVAVIVKDSSPFSIGEGVGFKEFFHPLNSSGKVCELRKCISFFIKVILITTLLFTIRL